MICCDRCFYSRPVQKPYGLKRHILHFYLVSAGKIRPHNGRKSAFPDLLRDQMSFTAMIQRRFEAKFLGNTDCRLNIICPVDMSL